VFRPSVSRALHRKHRQRNFKDTRDFEDGCVDLPPVLNVVLMQADRFEDISLRQWLALTPRQLVKAHLGLDDEVLDRLGTEKLTLVK